MRKRLGVAFLSVVLISMLSAGGAYARNKTEGNKPAPPLSTKKSAELRLSLRDLWVEHTIWVRLILFAHLYNDKDAARSYEQRAIENAKAIADTLIPFYGKDAAEKFNKLLSAHYAG